MAVVELTDQEWTALINVIATTKEWPWTVTNPLLTKISQQLEMQKAIKQKTNSTEKPANTEEVVSSRAN